MADENTSQKKAKVSPKYESVVFSAFAVPTIPFLDGTIGDPGRLVRAADD